MKNKYYNNIEFTAIESVKTTKAGSKGLKLTLNGFYKEYIQQVKDWVKKGLKISKENKFYQFCIQPQPSGYRESKESIKEYSQVCFIDIDSKAEVVKETPLEGVTDKIIERYQEIMKDSPFIIMQKSISDGLHIIAYMNDKAIDEEDYKAKATYLTAYFCKRVKEILGVDLTSIKGVVDTHNINPAQLLLVSPTALMTNVDFKPVELHEKELEEQFPTLFQKSQDKGKREGHEGEYTPIECDMTKRYMVSVDKNAKFEHLYNDDRFKLGTTLKTLIANGSITTDFARMIYKYIIRKTSVINSSYEDMEKEFESILIRSNIKPMLHIRRLNELGIKIVAL